MNDTTEWLAVMLGEIDRKQRERVEALEETKRREDRLSAVEPSIRSSGRHSGTRL